MNDKGGFGIEDSPFQILAAVIVLLITAAVGAQLLNSFMHGSECQKASDAALEIQKYANLVSAESAGSKKIVSVSIPAESRILFNGGVVLNTRSDRCVGNKTLSVEGVSIQSSEVLNPGYHTLELEFLISHGDAIINVTRL